MKFVELSYIVYKNLLRGRYG